MSESKLLRYKRLIKDWEKQFLAENGKLPSKSDCKADKEIWKAYKTYNQLKETDKTAKPPEKRVESKSTRNVEDEMVSKTDNGSEQLELAFNAEFGPTPQANGKVLSIFDMIVSPPESSPLKKKGRESSVPQYSSPEKSLSYLPSPQKTHSVDTFKTPTKAPRKLQLTDLTPSRRSPSKQSVLSQLQQASSPQKPLKVAESNAGEETPLYLGKVNKMFLFNDTDASPIKSNNYSTPVKEPVSLATFNTTPSPLKPLRLLSFGSKKSLSALFHECQNLEVDQEFKAQKQENEREIQASVVEGEEEAESVEPSTSRKRKRITQKRTTRRWKIKPRGEHETEEFDGKDVHAELQKIQDYEQKTFEDYMQIKDDESDVITDDDDNEDEIYVKPDILNSSGRKKKTLSNNYQRLKINDPRTKRFKQRMKRR